MAYKHPLKPTADRYCGFHFISSKSTNSSHRDATYLGAAVEAPLTLVEVKENTFEPPFYQRGAYLHTGKVLITHTSVKGQGLVTVEFEVEPENKGQLVGCTIYNSGSLVHKKIQSTSEVTASNRMTFDFAIRLDNSSISDGFTVSISNESTTGGLTFFWQSVLFQQLSN